MLSLQRATLGIFLDQSQVILPEYQFPKSWEKFFPISPIFCLLVQNLKDLFSYVFSIPHTIRSWNFLSMYPPSYQSRDCVPSLGCGASLYGGRNRKWSSSWGGHALSHEAPPSDEVFADLQIREGCCLKRERVLLNLGRWNSKDSRDTRFSGLSTSRSQGHTLIKAAAIL